MFSYTFSEADGRFRDSRGRFVSEAQVRRVIDDIADQASARMAAASEALLEGRMSLGAWQAEMEATIKLAHVSTAVLAHGGAAQMRAADWLSAAREIKAQYRYLRDFAGQVQSGAQPLNGSLTARAKQYGQAARGTFAKTYGEGQQQRGFIWERNVIQSGESCAGCRTESAKDWTPTGTLIPVGSRRPCGPNCRCRVVYSRAREVAA